jgi:hypothetical protein
MSHALIAVWRRQIAGADRHHGPVRALREAVPAIRPSSARRVAAGGRGKSRRGIGASVVRRRHHRTTLAPEATSDKNLCQEQRK